MKFKETPLQENFILTNKKKRIITAVIDDFVSSHYYSYVTYKEIPSSDMLNSFLNKRIIFLKNLNFFCEIIISNKKWKGIIWKYCNKSIEYKIQINFFLTF